ncbi:MAG: histidine triad nucleotide-binding protein [Calditrichaeota bacterium]|nr:MAG: histidine triad nucleotide-binding protein [Calditrichota bacterium]
MSCIFCKIVDGSLPARKVYEDDDVLAFHDVNPQAPVHVLVIPKQHIAKFSDFNEHEHELIGKIFYAAKKVAEELQLTEDGFRLVVNNGANAHQTVFHLHVHILGGRKFTWPPG